jgi:hypothetical protein
MNRIKTLAAVLGFFLLPIVGYAAYGGITWGYDSSASTPKLSVVINGVWYEVAFFSNGNFVSITSEFDVTRYGADPTGVADSASAIANAISTGNRKVTFPCGIFSIASVIALPSNTELAGSGSCTVIKGMATLAFNERYADWYGGTTTTGRNLISNENFAGTDHDIYVHDFATDGTLVTSGAMHHITFASASHIRVERVRFLGAGAEANQNATSFIGQSHHYAVKDNYAEGTMNACFDQWDGPHDFEISGNTCEGNGYTLNGVQVNGISSGTPRILRTASRFRIIGNNVRSTAGSSISVRGLCVGSDCGVVERGEVIGNTIEDDFPAGNATPGIFVGEGSDIGVGFNVIKGTRGPGIVIAGGLASSITRNVTAANNTLVDTNKAYTPGTVAAHAIYIGNTADAPDNISLIGNLIRGGLYEYAIRVHASSTNVKVYAGPMAPGLSGVYLAPASTNTLAIGVGDDLHPFASTSAATWKDSSGGNTLRCGVISTFPICDGLGQWLLRVSGVTKITLGTSSVTTNDKLITTASASGKAGFNVPHGAAPSSPSNGDFWSTTVAFFARVNGATKTFADLESAQTISGVKTYSNYTDIVEMSAPAAPPANTLRFYAEDNGAGKTRFMVRFPSGAAQQLAIEP